MLLFVLSVLCVFRADCSRMSRYASSPMSPLCAVPFLPVAGTIRFRPAVSVLPCDWQLSVRVSLFDDWLPYEALITSPSRPITVTLCCPLKVLPVLASQS